MTLRWQQDLIRDLRQLDCEEVFLHHVEETLQQQRYSDACRLLQSQKCRLLAKLHQSQSQVDLLDFLLYQVKQVQKQKGGI